MFGELPDSVLRRPPTPMLAAYDHFTATIAPGGSRDPGVFEEASPTRMAVYDNAERLLGEKGTG